MKTVAEILRNADPLADEPRRNPQQRLARRQMWLDASARVNEVRERRRGSATIVALALAGLVVGTFVWSRIAVPDVVAAVRFEVRLAEATPTLGLRDVVIAGTTQRIYLHPDPVVTNGDIVDAHVIEGDTASTFGVSVAFNDAGAAKMRRATESHIGRPVALLVDGQVIAAPVVRSRIASPAVISGNFTKAEAERIANGIVGR